MIFGDLDRERTSTSKLQSFCQGSRLAYVYAFEFKKLTCDISWDKVAFMSWFQFGLHNDMKDLFLTMPNPTTLSQIITQLVHCVNCLFEHHQNKHWESLLMQKIHAPHATPSQFYQ